MHILPNTSVPLPCPCLSADIITAKCNMGTTSNGGKPRATVPWMNRTAGAAFQDALYGKGIRLHNIGSKGNAGKDITATCTVCGQRKLI